MKPPYRGRFAPTPSGPLHFGSLVAAMGSFLEARSHQGTWQLRIDDLDPPRVQPGATLGILRCLTQYGLHWDGPVIYQRTRSALYHAALHRLHARRLTYPCACSRAEIARTAANGIEGPVYPGTCRHGTKARARAWRLNLDDAVIVFDDAVQGPQRRNLTDTLGDFVLYRADGVFSFHLASAVDDAVLGMTDIVRGADLLESSARQLHVQTLLGYPPPRYTHLPVAMTASGEKLSKQTHAPDISRERPQGLLLQALAFLGQHPPPELEAGSVADIWRWALTHWQLSRVPQILHLEAGNSAASARKSSGNT